MIPQPQFLRRFEQIRTQLRRYQVGLGLAATVLIAATGLGLLAWSDFHRELTRSTRAGGLAVASVLTCFVVWRWLIAPLRWWTQPRTAAEIEGRFPELGQRIRTVVQYAGQPTAGMTAAGVKPSLVAALAVETDQRSSPLPLDRIVRWRRAMLLATLAAVPVGLLAFAAARNPEWRIAIGRAILIERPYTTVEVRPGDVLVDQGADVPVVVALRGRPRPVVSLQTRPVGKLDAPWKSEKLGDALQTTVEKVKDPVEYRVVAGPAVSSAYSIQVRYPLTLKAIDVEVKAPAYTGLDPKTSRGGDVQAVEGSTATFKIALDVIPTEATLELVDLSLPAPKPGEPPVAPTILPLKRDGDSFVATLELVKDLDYKVVARTADGRVLPKNKYRIDVVEDRAPRVAFDEPDEALEVHTIAEVRHRARVTDDFGLTKTGIVFRFNDGEEQTLISQDFAAPPGQKPKTTATLEEILLIETLNATPQDSVTYYAFAEDNYPAGPRRTETDLRYIDFRAFKREYKLAEPASGDGDPMDLIALDELIGRQRVNLNRANRLAKRRPTDRSEADDPLKIAGFEETLINLTKEFTEGIEQLADAKVESLHKALDAMQAAIDALDRARLADAPPAMAEALKHLVASRRELINLIGNNPALAKAMRAFDRRQAQKIRKPKNKDEEAEELVNRLEELAQEEDFIYATIAASMEDPAPTPPQAGPKGRQPGTPSAPPKAGEPKDAEPKDQPQGQDGPKGAGDKPPGEPKGEVAQGPAGSKGPGTDGPSQENTNDGAEGEPKKLDRRAVAEKQEKLVDEIRDLAEKLKRLEAASDLAKARMGKATEKVEQTSSALTRGNTKEAAADAKEGAGMLHELARQVKGEITREATDELAMARDLADELRRREAELADRTAGPPPAAGPGNQPGQNGKAAKSPDGKGPDGQEAKGDAEPGTGPGEKPGSKPGPGGRGGATGWAALTEEEQINRMAEMAKTLEGWLKQVDQRGEGKTAEAVREILDKGNIAEIVERADRMGEIRIGGNRPDLSREARELAARLEVIGQALELLHRGIVAPELAAMVEFDRRVAELTTQLATLTTEAEVAAWKRDVAALIRDLEKAGIAGATDLADALRGGGTWHWDADHRHFVGPDVIQTTFGGVASQIKDRIQDLILKDLASARDETTPPMFRELVERYYEVISRGVQAK